jgi:hypothetical protein
LPVVVDDLAIHLLVEKIEENGRQQNAQTLHDIAYDIDDSLPMTWIIDALRLTLSDSVV